MPLFSVIIPVFNAEKYLKKCIRSVLNQKNDKTEIILVDDCSTDNSKFIKHGISGYLFQNKDYIELANLIKNAFNNKLQSLKIANEGRNTILLNCNYHLEMEKVRKLYKQIFEY